MTVRVVEGERSDAPPVLPGVASLAVAGALGGDPRPFEILGSAGQAVWIGETGGVLVVTAGDAVRLPNGVHVVGAGPAPFRGIRPGDPAEAGGHHIRVGSVVVRAARWWDPVPALPGVRPEDATGSVAILEDAVPAAEDHGFAAALRDGDAGAAFDRARRLIGLGDGLTPRGDDLVAGTVAAFLLLGGALDDGGAGRTAARLEDPLLEHAAAATTAFSATLLAHAFRGEVAAPAGTLLQAMAGRGEIAPAAANLLEVGHSSGPALAAGILAGARAATERSI